MFLSGVNLALLFYLFTFRWRGLRGDEEFPRYLSLFLLASLFCTVAFSLAEGHFSFQNLRFSLFHVASTLSTCGFYTAEGNYDGVLSLFDHMCGKGNHDHILCGQGELFRVPELHERKYEIDSLCYPIRLAYEYWLVTGDDSIFGELWQEAMQAVLRTFKEQQRKGGNKGPYKFMRRDIDAKSSLTWYGWGPPVNPVGLIVSCFRPSDDATVLPFLVPSNFMAVSSLRKAGEILNKVNHNAELAGQCLDLAQEVEDALHKYAIVDHPKYGQIYAYEVDGWGGRILADDANVPSLLAMGYLGDVPMDDPIYRNTRRFVWSEDNPCFFKGKAGEGIGGAHTAYNLIWPMSIMMKAFTADNDEEIAWCMRQLLTTDAGTGFMHESFHKDDATHYTRAWFAWQNTLFGELVIHLVESGKANLLVHCLD